MNTVKKRDLFSSLSARLMVWFLVISLLPLSALGLSAYFNAKTSMQHEAMDRLIGLSRLKAQRLEDYFIKTSNLLVSLSRTRSIERALQSAETVVKADGIYSLNFAAIEKVYQPVFRHYIETNEFHDLFLIANDGTVVFTLARESDLGTNLRTGAYQDSQLAHAFNAVMATHHTAISGFSHYAPSNKVAGFIAAPIFHHNRLIGVLALQINMARFNQIAADYTGMGNSGETVLAAKSEDAVMFLTPLRFDPDAAFRRTATIGSSVALPMQQALSGAGGKGLSIDYRGKEVLAVWQYLPHTRLGMVVKMDADEAFASVSRFTYTLTIITILAVLGILAAALYVSGTITKPIRRLTGAAKHMSGGDYSDRIHVRSSDEIAVLANAFNQMAENLDNYVHKLKDKNIEIEKRSATLSSANEEIKSFAYIVSHDLRSPLVNMKGFTGELAFTLKEMSETIKGIEEKLGQSERETIDRLIDEEIPESMQFITTSVEKMDAMLTAILKLSRLGRRELVIEMIDLEHLCEEILDSLSHQIKESNTEVTLENLPTIENDRIVMEQIMGNLIGNALKYLDPDRPGKITISADRDSDGITISVSDNGYGISSDEKEKVFQIFRRGKHTEQQGEGMGLAYVQTLARAQDGSISFESEENRGSIFTVYLPSKPSSQD